jgi:hypothetical protein
MILEGLVTTIAADGRMHLAAMGPVVDDAERTAGRLTRLVLKPFATSQTAANLVRERCGVFQVTDDVLLLAQVVAGRLDGPPASRPADAVMGWRLVDACQAWEFTVDAIDDSRQRLEMTASVVREHVGRPFLGFSRAAHAVVEAAILVTRLHLLDRGDVRRQFDALRTLVEKTGGPRDREGFALLEAMSAGD